MTQRGLSNGPLPRIYYGRLHYWFSYDTAIFVVLVDAGAIVLGQQNVTGASYLESAAIVLTEDVEAL